MNELEKNNVNLPIIRCDSNGEGVLRLDKDHEYKNMIERVMSMILGEDDGAVIFNNRDNIISVAKITFRIIKKY